jgi:hypothetical protein
MVEILVCTAIDVNDFDLLWQTWGRTVELLEDVHSYERPVKVANLRTEVRTREFPNTKQEFETQIFCAVCAAHLKLLVLTELGKNVHYAIMPCARGRIVLERGLAK